MTNEIFQNKIIIQLAKTIDLLNKKNPPSRLVEAELVVRESTRIYRR